MVGRILIFTWSFGAVFLWAHVSWEFEVEAWLVYKYVVLGIWYECN